MNKTNTKIDKTNPIKIIPTKTVIINVRNYNTFPDKIIRGITDNK
jgi:hypothetical protein